jgi:hypothetical protein
MTHRTEALAFRIWQYANAREWDVSIADVASALGESPHVVRGVVGSRKWGTRLRTTSPDDGRGSSLWFANDEVAADVAAGRVGNGESV